MSGRRLLAATGAALAGLLLAATPASAAEPTVEWTTKPVIESPGDLVLKGRVTGDDGDKIESVSFTLNPIGPPEPEGDPCRAVIDGDSTITPESPQDVPMEFELPLKVPCNRTYEVSATVTRPAPLGVCPHIAEQCTTTTPPFKFEVVIRPARVSGLAAAYDPATKEVRLTWNPNPEPDLLGYRIERSPPGQPTFEAMPGLVTATEFVDPGIEARHRYRVVAVRARPTGAPIDGMFSAVVTAGPDTPAPTVPNVASKPAPGRTATGNRPTVRRRTATTVDTGFSQNLPFDPSQTTTSLLPSPEPDGRAAVLAEFDDDDDDRRATLVPIAGGLALLMSAVHVRLLSKRVGDDEVPIFPGS
jgi:hypothetical protein